MGSERGAVIGRTLREIRKDRKLSQKAVAERLHASQTFVSLAETNKRTLYLAEVVAYAPALGLTPTELYRRLKEALVSEGLVAR